MSSAVPLSRRQTTQNAFCELIVETRALVSMVPSCCR